LNEFDQELKKLQRELAKLKVLKRNGGRARKQLTRSFQREMELQSVLDDVQATEFKNIQIHQESNKEICKKCESHNTNFVSAGTRAIIICQDCGSRYTMINELAKTA
jgi:translation initiation factor 2 beta subunit (eIF-2beta)/eIF-5